MKKHLLVIVFLLVALIPVRGQQVIVNDSTMFISLQVDSLTEAERYFNPLYLIVQKGKEHLKQQLVRGSICDCDTTLPNRRIGIFSVAPNKHVTFSQGNLQYFPAAKLWKFADNQYDYLGVANDHLSPTFRNWVDLFGYSANNITAPFGISTSTNDADYAGDFVDWGNNWICGDKPNTWRTLDKEEWDYLLHKRHNASQLVGVANISGVNGLIILPDNWVEPAEVNFKSGFHTSFGREYFALHQQFTLEQWSIFEQRGAVFLPASGWRNGKTFTRESYGGHYWSTTKRDSTNAYYLSFSSQRTWINCNALQRGFSIRLVQDTIVPQVIPDPCMVVKINDTLSINMMCVEGGTMYIGRGDTVNRPYRQRPLRQVTISDFYLGQTEVTQELWLAIMGENPTYFPCDTCLCHPVDSVSIDEVLLFIERLNSLTGYNFRLPTEAEWEYAARGGVRSKGYAYAGSDNVNEVAWCRVGDSRGGTPHPVAQKRPNELGLYDMHGNLWEFVHDKFVDDINIYPSVNPTGPEGMRGSATGCGSAYYSALMPENTWGWVGTGGGRSRWFGFRLALSDQDPFVPITIGKYRFHMMYVQGGTFMMGSDAPDAEPNEKPVHEVILSDYYIGQTEVTQKLWKLVMGNNNNPSANKGDELPVTNISWDEAQAFVERLSELTGMRFRLPTEAEWEYAARGGQKSKGYTYAGSNDLKEVAWYNGNSGNTLHAVAQKKPNELGIYDMTGNAWEWCHDWYAPYSTEAQTNPQGPDSGTGRVLRSGSYVTVAERCTAKYRQSRQVDNPDVHIGFRLVLHDTIPIPPEPEYVDLGLSVKWATFNVGATSPEDYGDYFAWGETEPKETYSWTNYKWCDGTDANITKYNDIDGLTTLLPEDDAATANWGDKWRMPTKEELKELIDSCQWERVTLNSVIGNKITGPNGNSIFFPAAGSYNSFDNQLHSVDSAGWLYSSSAVSNTFAREISIGYSGAKSTSCSKCLGLTIRPVYDDRVTLTVIPTPADATVGFYYSGGFNVDSNSVKVKKGSSPLYQVAATKKGYLSQGDTLHHITQDTTLYIALRPFSKGTWVKVDTSEFTRVDSFFVSRHQGVFSGPYSSWSYFYAPVLPGETYRVRAHAGQHAALWYAASNAPDQAAGIRPTKVACSANGGIVRYIAEEFTIPEGANYLIINAASKGTNLIIERKVPDPCLVVKVNDTLSINLMCVKGGTFMMGAMEGDEIAKDDEKPAHKVTLTYDYHIMQTEVTQGLWEAVMGEDIYVAQTNMENAPKPAYVGADYPMYYVRMNDALEFIDKLNAMTGMHFRLPTEAEWEYAARGGNKSKGYLYAGSDDPNEVGWYYGRGMHHVAKLKPNELGIYDMSGNVSEMCLDYGTYGETYKAGDVVNPRGNIRANGNRFWRGGSYTHSKDSMRISHRSSFTPSWGGTWIGLRLVLAEDNDFRTIRVGNSYFDMSFVKGGTFMMGSDAPDAEADEQPVHEVTLSDYYIGQTEVTQHLWKAVMGSGNNPSATKGNNLPVTNISWDEAQAFVERLSELTGMRFRLPTEAEWEYAARGGQKSKGYTYAGSNDINEVAWYPDNCTQPQAIGLKKPNELGIYDMTGNLYEWCHDWYGAYSAEPQTNPQGPNSSSIGYRIVRGGCWQVQTHGKPDSHYCRIANRGHDINGKERIGLRIVLEVEK